MSVLTVSLEGCLKVQRDTYVVLPTGGDGVEGDSGTNA